MLLVIARGRVVADATPADLAAMHPTGKLDDVFRHITLPGSPPVTVDASTETALG